MKNVVATSIETAIHTPGDTYPRGRAFCVTVEIDGKPAQLGMLRRPDGSKIVCLPLRYLASGGMVRGRAVVAAEAAALAAVL